MGTSKRIGIGTLFGALLVSALGFVTPAQAARLIPSARKMLTVPLAAATSPAIMGMMNCPTRFPSMRSEFAVPRASAVASASRVAILPVTETPSAKPALAIATCMSQSGNGNAMMT